jgi:hypothetical protein
MAGIQHTLEKASATKVCDIRLRPPSFLSFVLSLILLVQTCALPIPVAFLFISANAAAVTEGCETKTCCTALCYVDEHGVHHCVHKHSESCARGESSDEPDVNPVLLTTLATVPDIEYLVPSLDPIGWTFREADLKTERYPTKPTPPPK